MGMIRILKRSIAKARLKDAGYERINKRMGMRAAKYDPPVWRRVTEGDLAEKAEEASKKASLKRKIADEAKKMKRRHIHAEPVPVTEE